MTIIEAIQQAEGGALITNTFLKQIGHFLKYIKGGVFYEYEIVDDKAIYKYEVREFDMAEILSNSWQVVEDVYFEKQ